MKKQLPKEFTFICDSESREQLEMLGVDINFHALNIMNDYYIVENNSIIHSTPVHNINYPLINLSDYLEQEQSELSGTIPASDSFILGFSGKPTDTFEIKKPTEQKWQDRTRGGYEYVIYEEFEGKIFGRMKLDTEWNIVWWYIDGTYTRVQNNHSWDLLPLDPHAQRKAEIRKQIEELQKELESLK